MDALSTGDVFVFCFWLSMASSILSWDTNSPVTKTLIFDTDETYQRFPNLQAMLFLPALFTTLFRCTSLVLLMTHHSPLTGQATNIKEHWLPSSIFCDINYF